MTTLFAFPGLRKLSVDEQRALIDAATWIGVDPNWLAAVMQFESDFSPSIRNGAGSGAVGLIQFMPATARGLGTTTAELAAMSFTDQLDYVKKYFAPHRGRLASLEDTYLAVFYPAFIDRPNDSILGHQGSAIYDQNAVFDRAQKGYVTKADITQTIRDVLSSAERAGTIEVPDGGGGGGGLSSSAAEIAVLLLVLGGLGWAAVTFTATGHAAAVAARKAVGV